MSAYDPRAFGALCSQCPLNGQKVIPPEGPLDASIALVGEAPGYNEIRLGRPFVGPSGVKLDDLLWGVRQDEDAALYADMRRQKVWITNALLCRPENKGPGMKKRYDVKEYVANIRRGNVALKKMKAPLVPSPFDCCKPRLDRELAALDAHARQAGAPNGLVVVPLGNFALELLTRGPDGKKGKQSIMKQRGSILFPEGTTNAATQAVQSAVSSPSDE